MSRPGSRSARPSPRRAIRPTSDRQAVPPPSPSLTTKHLTMSRPENRNHAKQRTLPSIATKDEPAKVPQGRVLPSIGTRVTECSASNTPPRRQLLIVDGDADLADVLAASLRFSGYLTAVANTGDEALAATDRLQPDLLVVDVDLPDMTGLDVARHIRGRNTKTPAVFLTSPNEPRNNLVRLTIGGDRYLVKPFSLDDLTTRVGTALRQAGLTQPGDGVLRFADLELEEESGRTRRAGRDIRLAPIEAKILRYLLRNAGETIARTQIIDHVWPYNFTGYSRALDVHISTLRRKLDERGPALIHTVHRIGYSVRLPHS
jgi:two-component system OmpR family response regulator